MLPDEVCKDDVADYKLEEPFDAVLDPDDVCGGVYVLVATGWGAQVSEVVLPAEVLGVF